MNDLERLIDRKLARLPMPRAPETLLPRVMRATRAAVPTPRTVWFTWPLVWQISALAAMVLLLAGAAMLWPIAAGAVAAAVTGAAQDTVARVGTELRDVSVIAGAVKVLWRVFMQPVALLMFLLVGSMFIACAAFGAALRHVVIGGRSLS